MRDQGEMLLPYQEREINGTLYRVSRLKLSRWLELSELVAKTLGDPVSDLLYGRARVDINKLMDSDIWISIGITALQAFSKSSMSKLVEILGGVCQADHNGGWTFITRDKADMYWSKNMRDLAPVFALFFEVQFADFFGGLAESLPDLPNEQDDLRPNTGESQSRSPSI